MVMKILDLQVFFVWGQAGDHHWEGLREEEHATHSRQNLSGRRKG